MERLASNSQAGALLSEPAARLVAECSRVRERFGTSLTLHAIRWQVSRGSLARWFGSPHVWLSALYCPWFSHAELQGRQVARGVAAAH